MYQFLDPIIGALVLATIIMFTLAVITITACPPEDNHSAISKWIYHRLNYYKPSTIFWNGLYWALFISTSLCWPELGVTASLIGSIIFVLVFLLGASFEFEGHSWPLSTLAFWFILIIFTVASLLHRAYIQTIQRFNDFLNKRKQI